MNGLKEGAKRKKELSGMTIGTHCFAAILVNQLDILTVDIVSGTRHKGLGKLKAKVCARQSPLDRERDK